MKHIHWSKDETNIVAKEFVRRFAQIRPSFGYILKAQEILPIERQRRSIGGPALDAFRERVLEIVTAVESHDESTLGLIGETHIAPSTETVAVIASPVQALAVPEPLRHRIQRAEVAAAPALNGHHQKSDLCDEIVGLLVEVNHQVIRLTRFNGCDLKEATRSALNGRRLRNLADQAANGLSYFTELVRIAGEH